MKKILRNRNEAQLRHILANYKYPESVEIENKVANKKEKQKKNFIE